MARGLLIALRLPPCRPSLLNSRSMEIHSTLHWPKLGLPPRWILGLQSTATQDWNQVADLNSKKDICIYIYTKCNFIQVPGGGWNIAHFLLSALTNVLILGRLLRLLLCFVPCAKPHRLGAVRTTTTCYHILYRCRWSCGQNSWNGGWSFPQSEVVFRSDLDKNSWELGAKRMILLMVQKSGEPVEVGSFCSSLFAVFFTSQVVVWDFWTINSI